MGDDNNLGVGMSANVSKLTINSINLTSYHWLILIGVTSSLCIHMISYPEYSKIGRWGLGIFYILYGVAIMVLSEFQRPFILLLHANNFIDSSMNNATILRILLILAFVCMASGLSLLSRTKYLKIGIVLLIGQSKRNEKEHGIGQNDKVDIQSMLEYHEQYIYPTDYQLLRIINLAMILSGTLFELLKIYSPQKALESQADYSNVDEKEIFEKETSDFDADKEHNLKNRKRGGNKKNNKRKKNTKKSEPKKTK